MVLESGSALQHTLVMLSVESSPRWSLPLGWLLSVHCFPPGPAEGGWKRLPVLPHPRGSVRQPAGQLPALVSSRASNPGSGLELKWEPPKTNKYDRPKRGGKGRGRGGGVSAEEGRPLPGNLPDKGDVDFLPLPFINATAGISLQYTYLG